MRQPLKKEKAMQPSRVHKASAAQMAIPAESVNSNVQGAAPRLGAANDALIHCIFCRRDKAPSLEHIIPLALGGTIETNRVCKSCNDTLGANADAALVDHPLVALKRAEYALAGNSGRVPDSLQILLGRGEIVGSDGQRVRVTTDAAGRPDVHLLYHARETPLADGTVRRRVSVDARDRARLPAIIVAERRRAGLAPLAPAELAGEAERLAAANREAFTDYRVGGSVTIDVRRFRLGLMKIAYELACLWLGDAYLDLPDATVLRDVVLEAQPLDAMEGRYSAAFELLPPLLLWRGEPGRHIVAGWRVGETARIGIKLFDKISAVVDVGKTPGMALDRFTRLDITTGKPTDLALSTELRRLRRRDHQRRLRGSAAL